MDRRGRPEALISGSSAAGDPPPASPSDPDRGAINDVVASSPRRGRPRGPGERARPDRRQVLRVARSKDIVLPQVRREPMAMAELKIVPVEWQQGYRRSVRMKAIVETLESLRLRQEVGTEIGRAVADDLLVRPRQSPREYRARRNRPGPRRPNSTLTPVSSDGRRPFRPVRPGSEAAAASSRCLYER